MPDTVLTLAVPVLWRPERIKSVLRDFSHLAVDVLFLPDRADEETITELEKHHANYSFAHDAEAFGVPTYETKVNHAFEVTDTPYLMYGADDITPENGWLANAMSIFRRNPKVGLLATNDGAHHLVMKGLLATHGILRRAYVEEYGSASHPDAGPVFYEGYRHWCCDAEASYVARQRGAFNYSPTVMVTHKRRDTVRKKGEDRTYLIGKEYADRDRALLAKRCPGWPKLG
jgi:hypothetical protein